MFKTKYYMFILYSIKSRNHKIVREIQFFLSLKNIMVNCGLCHQMVGSRKKHHNRTTTPCKHVFHKTCLNKYLQTCSKSNGSYLNCAYNKTCPTCSSPIENKYVDSNEQLYKVLMNVKPPKRHDEFCSAVRQVNIKQRQYDIYPSPLSGDLNLNQDDELVGVLIPIEEMYNDASRIKIKYDAPVPKSQV